MARRKEKVWRKGIPVPPERKLSKVSVRIFAEKSPADAKALAGRSDFVQDRQPIKYTMSEKNSQYEKMLLSLQKATMEDVQTLLGIEKTTIGLKTYSGYFTEKEIKEYLDNSVVYLIKKDYKIVGSISYEIKDENHAYLSGLVIKPEFHKQGLAKQALVKLLEKLNGFKVIDLVVHPDNVSALKLYKSFGFVVKDRKENFYGDGEPRLIMVLEK